MSVFVFRINSSVKLVREELKRGNLRQGWGGKGMTIEQSCEEFVSSWINQWGEGDTTINQKKRKYDNLCIMKEIKTGDIIVVPKFDLNDDLDYSRRCFTVVECIQPYQFAPIQEKDDYGHIIKVKPLFSCKYGYNHASMTVSAKFKAYQSALNRIYKDEFLDALNKLIAENSKESIRTDCETKDFTYIMAQELLKKYDELVKENLNNLSTIDPKSFEYLIKELFEKNGFICNRMNYYDGLGGDIDIQMMLDEKSLLGAIFKQANCADNFYINIQAKKKPGMDWDSKEAVKQLVDKRASSPYKHYLDIVIDLTEKYTDDTISYADKNNVLLINGKQFAYLLLQFGLTEEIDIFTD